MAQKGFQVMIPRVLAQRLQPLAEARGVPASHLVRMAVYDWLEKVGIDPETGEETLIYRAHNDK